jgi:sugar/nucleoside kinase (ribokinase family)
MFEFEYSDIAMSYVRGAKHLHLSSYFLLRALRPRIPELFREAKAAGLSTSLDTNDDPEDKWEADLREVFAHLDILFVNEREAKKMTGLSDHTMAADALAERVPMVVMKRGALPAVCRAGKNEWSAAPPRVEVVDSVGAGDSFAAGFIHQHLRGAKPADSLAFANAAGAYSTTRAGGTEAFRDREALRDFLERQGWEQAKSSVDND